MLLCSGPSAGAVTAVARAAMLDEQARTGQVVERGGPRAAAALEPPALHEFEPDHLVAEPG